MPESEFLHAMRQVVQDRESSEDLIHEDAAIGGSSHRVGKQMPILQNSSHNFGTPFDSDNEAELIIETPPISKPPPATEIEEMACNWQETGLEMGEASSQNMTFTPWLLVRAYPDLYVGKVNGERVSQPSLTREQLHQLI